MNWLNGFLAVLALSLLGYHGYCFFLVDEVSIKASIRLPAERTVIQFDEENYQRLNKMIPGKTFQDPNTRDFGKGVLFER